LDANRFHAAAAMAIAFLLCGCSGMKNLLPGDTAEANQAAAVPAAGPRRTRMTSRDIMLEWGTQNADNSPYKRPRSTRFATPLDSLDEPAYVLTVPQIMANAACRSCDERPYHDMVVNASLRHGVPASLIHAVIEKESGYNPAVTSRRRARGLMQVTPETARYFGIGDSRRLYDPQTNINTGTAYLKYLLENYDTVDEALAAYNAGPGNVKKYRGVPPFRETKRYVRDVKKLYSVTAK
jgi:soluble lytic murein transglycosylase-like protein